MSASREKKIRQELAQSGIPDIKEIRAAEERKQQRRANWLYGSVAVAFVVIAAALLIWNSNIIQRGSTAISVDGVKYSAAEVNYYYYNAFNNVAGGEYAGYISLNAYTPLTQQVMNDTDLLFMGVSLEEGQEEMTWHEFFLDIAKDNLIHQTAVLNAAKAENFAFTDEMKAEEDATIAAMDAYAKQSGVTTATYLKNLFGPSMTTPVFKDLLHNALIVSFFQEQYWDSLTYTGDQLQDYYEENRAAFDVADYEYIYFKGTADSTKDADGKTVAPTDEQNAAAKAAAEAAAKAALARYEAGEDLETIAKDYKMATYYHQEAGTNSGGTVQTWVFDDSRTAGDKTMLNSGSTYYVAGFTSRSRNDYDSVNVRHILCKVNTTGLDSTAADYNTKLQVLIDAQEVEAQAILDEWKAGAADAESFAKLANEKSDDTGSNTNGGLYTQVGKGEMVTEFNDWIFDESRQVGDTDIIFVDAVNYTGYHVMYFDGWGAPYWELQVENTMRNNDYAEWTTALVEGLEAEEHNGLKYVG